MPPACAIHLKFIHSKLIMKIINWTLTVIIAFSFVACTSGTDNTTKHEVVTKTTTETTQVATETTTEVAEATTEVVENTTKAQPLEDAKAQEEKVKTTAKKDVPEKTEKTNIPKPKEVVEKVKEAVKREAEEVKNTAEKVIWETKEAVQTTTTAATETAKTIVEPIKEKVIPPPPPKVETKPTPTPVVEKSAPKVEEKPIPKPKLPLSHEAWDALLRKHVSPAGTVNYSGFKSEKGKLQDYLDLLANNPPKSDWERSKTMAYWINAYNAFTVKLIVDNYPLGSITDLEGGKPWSKRWIKLGDQTYTLDQIEKEILLKKYKDARVHFAVNCAAKSCPALLNQAWTASNLESNFERQTKSFINNPQFNEISPKSAKVSQLFNWYANDFGDVKAFINKYANTQLKSNAKIDFMEYNWKLNE